VVYLPLDIVIDIVLDIVLVGGILGIPTPLKNMKVNGKDYPIYYGKQKMFQSINQI